MQETRLKTSVSKTDTILLGVLHWLRNTCNKHSSLHSQIQVETVYTPDPEIPLPSVAEADFRWTEVMWKTVLWSDESKFEILFGNYGRQLLWAKEDRDHQACSKASIMYVWPLTTTCSSESTGIFSWLCMRDIWLYLACEGPESHHQTVRPWQLVRIFLSDLNWGKSCQTDRFTDRQTHRVE